MARAAAHGAAPRRVPEGVPGAWPRRVPKRRRAASPTPCAATTLMAGGPRMRLPGGATHSSCCRSCSRHSWGLQQAGRRPRSATSCSAVPQPLAGGRGRGGFRLGRGCWCLWQPRLREGGAQRRRGVEPPWPGRTGRTRRQEALHPRLPAPPPPHNAEKSELLRLPATPARPPAPARLATPDHLRALAQLSPQRLARPLRRSSPNSRRHHPGQADSGEPGAAPAPPRPVNSGGAPWRPQRWQGRAPLRPWRPPRAGRCQQP